MEFVQLLGGINLDIFLASCNAVGLFCLITLGFLYALSGLDDFFVDLVGYLGRCWPRRLSENELAEMLRKEEKAIAIVVPAWQEWEVIAKMLGGNISRIDYQNYHFFVGVYPNDAQTMAEVRAVGEISANVHAVVNCLPGPTSKGQVLNYTIKQVLQHEEEFDTILIHDAEDVVHPLSLKLVNHCQDRYDFVQIPVFSLQRSFRQLVAGTYIDEFAEAHTKDLLVRSKLGAAVPSAGVGTSLSRRLVERLRRQKEGNLFNESSLTEDYELGLGVRTLRDNETPASAHFVCAWYRSHQTGAREFIATREYFPKAFRQSVRQKTRWIVGIVFQGARNLGWRGSLPNRYFLARDRKAVFTNVGTLIGYLLLAEVTLYAWLVDPLPMATTLTEDSVALLFGVNVFFMCNRVLQRHICVYRVYGPLGALPVILRWPVAILINAYASLRAAWQHVICRVGGRQIAWAKTSHEIPEMLAPAQKLSGLVSVPPETASTSVGEQS